MASESKRLFTKAYAVNDDVTMRRVVNVMLKRREKFAVSPDATQGGTIFLTDAGVAMIDEEGLLL